MEDIIAEIASICCDRWMQVQSRWQGGPAIAQAATRRMHSAGDSRTSRRPSLPVWPGRLSLPCRSDCFRLSPSAFSSTCAGYRCAGYRRVQPAL